MMNYNVDTHFAIAPQAEIPRATFERPCEYHTTFNCGDCIPFYVEEVLPGSTHNISTAKVVRTQSLLTPVMGNIFLDTMYFFVPSRLVWDHWKEFCGENTESAWAPEVSYSMPSISAPAGGFEVGTIADYMGLPVGVEWNATDELAPMALPFRAYALICNEFFRDENLTDPLLIPTDDAHQIGSNGDNYITDVANGGKPFRAAKVHDYFTSALPNSQKGSPVGIPISVPTFSGGVFPVSAVKEYSVPTTAYPAVFAAGQGRIPSTEDLGTITPSWSTLLANGTESQLINNSGGTYNWNNFNVFTPVNLAVDIPSQAAGDSVNVEFSVNELRLAFAYQKFLEALARGGSRYTETIRSLFGVVSPDARLQRPEYLGGNRVPIHVSEVTNMTEGAAALGNVAGKSHTNDSQHSLIKSFTEHGYIIGIMVARYTHSYQGINRMWMRKTFTDFYNPKFAHLGEVPIYQAEIFTDGQNLSKDKVFGFQEIWAEYRYKPNLCTGLMRPGVEGSLAHWNLCDDYESVPYLSDEWIRETPANLDRCLAVTSEVSPQFWADILVMNKCTQPMPLYSVPGLIDHF